MDALENAPRIDADEVKQRMLRGEPVIVVDARKASAWADADRQGAGAIRIPPDQVDGNAGQIPRAAAGRLIVAYCT